MDQSTSKVNYEVLRNLRLMVLVNNEPSDNLFMELRIFISETASFIVMREIIYSFNSNWFLKNNQVNRRRLTLGSIQTNMLRA